MLSRLNIAAENIPRTKLKLHVIIGALVLVTFILTIARVADSGTPRARTNTWGFAVCIKSAVFMAYQVLTAHVESLKRWANTKVNVVLNIIDTVFWFALIIISIMGTMGSRSLGFFRGSVFVSGGTTSSMASCLAEPEKELVLSSQ
ncbi:predicted protein [Aspergillus nidulans FGSC A4]|uniref:MARVEL domain-containing protein n=1 Tax=Emericella nidulans (strain FGSC A4 / ATCC 38163 / CBS 112.46 / NRRL 194 / M139) TaxID=227321 RepID=Q5B7H3_EMENI|nr:hypothetical protein [Aspergillus nidulans FGSC A4]EAA59068.1 predicted protein [Aspergillus nidulans FGSC A4]CBF76014.1 TPA: conserved hypothetical protein [Aspergillus nidulans FGSC A4]|eukprot:XP_661111.1 predicted protein [Aspergillus nidulans FGSC A4]